MWFCRVSIGVLLVFFSEVLFAQTHTVAVSEIECENSAIEKQLNKNIRRGYVGYSVDYIDTLSNKLVVYQGERYKWGNIQYRDGESIEIKKPRGSFSVRKFNYYIDNYTSEYLNSGYPFARLDYDYKVNNRDIYFDFTINRGDYIVFDSLKLDSAFMQNKKYLYGLLRMKPLQAYNNSNVQSIPKRVNNSGIFTIKRQYLSFTKERKALVDLELEKVKSNAFSAVLGLQTGENRKTTFTGNVNLKLVNSFNRGERINFDWVKYDSESQNIHIAGSYPYLFNSPLGIESELIIKKQDSTFTYSQISGGINVDILNNGNILLSTTLRQSSYNNFDTVVNAENTFSRTVGLSYRTALLDRFYNPTKGYVFKMSTDVGSRLMQKRTYERESVITYISLDMSVYLPISKVVIAIKNCSYVIISDSLNRGELNAIGGAGLLRGFDENSIFTDKSTVFSLEPRYLLSSWSNIYAFIDYALTNEPFSERKHNNRIGFGAGLSLKTKAGMLSVAYALGRNNYYPVKINEAKIHIGYLNNF